MPLYGVNMHTDFLFVKSVCIMFIIEKNKAHTNLHIFTFKG